MIRNVKIAVGLLLGVLTACSSATDPEEAKPLYKNCIDDFRRIEIVSPREEDLAQFTSAQEILIQWAAIEVCGPYSVTLTIIFQGQEFQLMRDVPNVTSCLWIVPHLPTQTCGDWFSITIRVEAWDKFGTPIPGDEIGVVAVHRCGPTGGGRGQQRD